DDDTMWQVFTNSANLAHKGYVLRNLPKVYPHLNRKELVDLIGNDPQSVFSPQNLSRLYVEESLHFSPPDQCERCGERTWELQSLSPSGASATWFCEYCKKRLIIRRDAPDSSDSMRSTRPSIPREVQREVWRRDNACCVECGSQ